MSVNGNTRFLILAFSLSVCLAVCLSCSLPLTHSLLHSRTHSLTHSLTHSVVAGPWRILALCRTLTYFFQGRRWFAAIGSLCVAIYIWDQKTKCITMQLSAKVRSEANTVHSLFTVHCSPPFVRRFVRSFRHSIFHSSFPAFGSLSHFIIYLSQKTKCISVQPAAKVHNLNLTQTFQLHFIIPARLWLTAAFHHLSHTKDESHFTATFCQSPRRLCGVTTSGCTV